MSFYAKTRVCTKCGFKDSFIVKVYGDFDGWDAASLRMTPSQCPFCKHAKKLGMTVKEQSK